VKVVVIVVALVVSKHYRLGLHAFGNNSAESEPIWMKSGTV